MSSGRGLRVLAGIAVAALFLGLLARGVNWAEVRRVLAGAQWSGLAAGLGALAADLGIRITRWWLMLRAVEPGLPVTACIRPFLSGLALNNTVPLRAGDVVRAFGFRQTLRAPVAHIAGTLVLERMLDLLVLVAILFAALAGAANRFPPGFTLASIVAGVLTFSALAALTAFPRHITKAVEWLVIRLFSRRRWLPSVSRAAAEVTSALALLRNPARGAGVLALSILAWVLEGVAFACVTWALHLSVPWPAPWLALGAGTLATLLPSSPGYVGTFDYFAALGLTAYGATASGATAFALLTHLLLWLPVTVVGLGVLVLGRKRSSTHAPESLAETGISL